MSFFGALLNGMSNSMNTTKSILATAFENDKDRRWNAQQAEINRKYQTGEREAAQEYNTSEREAAQAYNSAEAEKSRDWQTAEREATQEWNLEQWNRENEYNSPQAQMERLVAAGINPNAGIQQITGSAPGTVRSSAQGGAQAAGSAPGHSSGQSGSVASSNVNPGAIGQIISGSANTLWQNLYQQAQLESLEKDNAMRDKELGIFDRQFELTSREIEARINDINKGIEDKDADIKLKKQQFEFLTNMNDVQLKTAKMLYNKYAAEIRQIDQQIENLKKQNQLTDEQIKNVQADTQKKVAETGLIGAQQELTESEKALTDVKVLIEQKNNTIKNLEVEASEQGISFTAPDFVTLFEFEQKTGKNAADELMKPTMEVERRRAFRDAGIETGSNLIDIVADGLSGFFLKRRRVPKSPKSPKAGTSGKKFNNKIQN